MRGIRTLIESVADTDTALAADQHCRVGVRDALDQWSESLASLDCPPAMGRTRLRIERVTMASLLCPSRP